MISVVELHEDRLEDFFQYLSFHVSENGQDGSSPFLPLSKQQSALSDELKAKFGEGMNKTFGENGWRKIWIALTPDDKIVAHIDIRSNNQSNAAHRVLLGMGVDANFRRLKIGQKLLESLIEYCRKNPDISWIDLEVMDNNTPAKRLYEKLNFERLGTTKDMFRIDNVSYDFTSMTLNVENEGA